MQLGDYASAFDSDGLPNLIEFSLGLNPKRNSAGTLPTSQILSGNHVVNFTQPTDIKDIIHGGEWSKTLLPDSWIAIPDTAGPPQHSFSVSTDTRSQIFRRLKVSAL